MSLFMVLVVAGKIAGTWGPLPYDIAECQRRQADFQSALLEHEKTQSWRVSCEQHEERPRLGSARKEPT